MRKKLPLLLFFVIVVQITYAQHDISKDLMKDIQKVHDYAQKGYEQLNAHDLLKAANILIMNPTIQQLKRAENLGDAAVPTTDEEDIPIKNYFNPEELLKDARAYAPVDARLLKWRIRWAEKKLKNYNAMSIKVAEEGSDIEVKNYLIYAKNSKTIEVNFEENKTITLSVRVGDELQLSVVQTKGKRNVGKSEVLGDAKLVSFKTKDKGRYLIKIENNASKVNDCLLMIETRD